MTYELKYKIKANMYNEIYYYWKEISYKLKIKYNESAFIVQ